MKAILRTVLAAAGFIFFSCDSGTDTQPSDDITPEKFQPKASMDSRYDEYGVDTADASGNNPDRLMIETRVTVQESVVDTNVSFAGKTGVSMHIATYPNSRKDTLYFWQDANGDLYRYNYGFNMLNIPELLPYLPAPIDMKWVLVMRYGKKEGAKWQAKKDSVFLPSFNTKVYFESNATMMKDTVIKVDTVSVAVRQAEHIITATASLSGIPVNGKIVARTYISAKYGKVVWDFIRSGNIAGGINAKIRGLWKIMTFHEEIK